MSGKYAKLLVFWGVLFVLSLFIIFSGIGSSILGSANGSDGMDKPAVDPDDPAKPEEEEFNLGMVLAVITAVASGGGFLATTYFAIRDDRREAAVHQLQIESLKKEIEHKDLEISRLRQEQNQKQVQEKKPPPSEDAE